jgi:hypothetical protein
MMILRSYHSIITELSLPQSINDARQKLRQAGWHKLAGGMFATVFEKSNVPYVLKLFGNHDHAYKRFLKLIRSQPDNPHFPKLRGLPMRVNSEYSAVRMEKLEKYNGRDRHSEDMTDINNFISLSSQLRQHIPDLQRPGNNNHVIDRIKKINKKLEPIIKQRPQLADALEGIHKHVIDPTGANFDIHDGNVMWRGKTPVLTDPVAYGDSAAIGDEGPLRAPRQFQFVFDKPTVRPAAYQIQKDAAAKPLPRPQMPSRVLFTKREPRAHGFTAEVKRRNELARRLVGDIDAAVAKKRLKRFGQRLGKNKIVYDMLVSSKGTTKKEILAATGWKQVSIAGMAHMMGLEVRKVKYRNTKGFKETRYFGYIPAHTVVIKKRKRGLRDIAKPLRWAPSAPGGFMQK